MAKFVYGDVDVSVNEDVILHDLLWESRKVEFERVRNSKLMYESFDPLVKEALLERVKHVLSVMQDNVAEWVPDSFARQEIGSCLRLEFDIMVGLVEEDIIDKYELPSDMFNAAKSELLEILENWNDGPEDS
jgi:hypothetical protein